MGDLDADGVLRGDGGDDGGAEDAERAAGLDVGLDAGAGAGVGAGDGEHVRERLQLPLVRTIRGGSVHRRRSDERRSLARCESSIHPRRRMERRRISRDPSGERLEG